MEALGHPIYSGFLLGLLGTALALGEWRGIAGLALACIGWGTKSRLEEAFMAAQFGAGYAEYQHGAGNRGPSDLRHCGPPGEARYGGAPTQLSRMAGPAPSPFPRWSGTTCAKHIQPSFSIP
jgi:hypothetical protein